MQSVYHLLNNSKIPHVQYDQTDLIIVKTA